METTTMLALMTACLAAVVITGMIMHPSCERAESQVKIACINAGGSWDGRAGSCTGAPVMKASAP